MNGSVTRFGAAVALVIGLGSSGLPGATPAAAQDLTMGLQANITSIDPHFHNLSPNSNVAQHIFDRLVHQDEKQRLIPGLATEWKAIDELTWEFKLRRGVKFHDGSEFDAQDVFATLKRVPWVPNSPSAFTIYTRAIDLEKSEIVDSHTVRFKTRGPSPLVPIELSAINIVSRKFVEAPTGDFNAGRATIGTGPFRFIEFVPGDRVVLQRNDAYWGPKPHWARATLKIISNDAARAAALLAGDVQIIENVPSPDLPKFRNDQRLAVQEVTSNRVIYLALDQARDQSPFVTDKAGAVLPNNPLKDRRVRQAMSKAFNRAGIVDRVFEGAAIPAGDLLPAGFFGTSPKLHPDKLDQEGARKLLAAAGYPNGFAVTLHGPNDRYPNDEKVLQAIGPMLSRVGIDAKVVTLPWATFASQASAPHYAYSVMLFGWGSGTGEMSSPLRSLIATPNREKGMGPSNRGRYSNPNFDALIEKAVATVDDKAREKLLQEATEMAMADYAVIPLYYQKNIWATRKGLTYTPRTDEFTLAQFVRPAG
jgi:peptide/nickel transport system substrate-binding protein